MFLPNWIAKDELRLFLQKLSNKPLYFGIVQVKCLGTIFKTGVLKCYPILYKTTICEIDQVVSIIKA